MERLLALFARIPADKQGHALAGALLFVIANQILMIYIQPTCLPLLSLLFVVITGVLKEVYDAFHPDIHSCDVWDAVATSAGGVLVLLAVLPYQPIHSIF